VRPPVTCDQDQSVGPKNWECNQENLWKRIDDQADAYVNRKRNQENRTRVVS